MDQRKEVEVYLAEKKYLPPLKLHLPNTWWKTTTLSI
jgi:hypothetical protein